jgi:hypothetical protein
VDRIVSSIRFHELTGTLTALFLEAFLDANELKAAAEEKRRVRLRAATNFMVVDFDLSCSYLQ